MRKEGGWRQAGFYEISEMCRCANKAAILLKPNFHAQVYQKNLSATDNEKENMK